MRINGWKLAAAAVMLCVPCQVWAEPTEGLAVNVQSEALELGETSETGYIPVYTEGTQFGTGSSSLRRAGSIPTKYDLRDEGLLTSVKNQGSANLCWAYSAMASAESGLIKDRAANSTIDLSEYHLGWTAYNGTNTDTNDATREETFLTGSEQTGEVMAAIDTIVQEPLPDGMERNWKAI